MNTTLREIAKSGIPLIPVVEAGPRPIIDGPNSVVKLRTLTLDLGTHTGWTLMVGAEIVESGTILLATEDELQHQRRHGNERTSDIRFNRLLDFIQSKQGAGLDRITFEDVTFAGSPDQTQLWASLRAAIWARVHGTAIGVFCVHVKTLKAFAGDGGADKSGMALALGRAEPGRYVADSQTGILSEGGRVLDDNEVDAIWLAHYTAAVDRGEREFLSIYSKKVARKAEKREKRAEQKARNKSLKAQEKSKLQALMLAVKATGKCCDVFRKPASHNRAICPKCGQTVRIQKPASSPSAGSADTVH